MVRDQNIGIPPVEAVTVNRIEEVISTNKDITNKLEEVTAQLNDIKLTQNVIIGDEVVEVAE